MPLMDRLKHAWNAFSGREPVYQNIGPGYNFKPDRLRLRITNERTIISSIYTRIAIDVSAINIFHCRIDQNGMYTDIIKSGLNNCLTIEANMDQTGRAFIQDVVMSMFDEGCVAIVPVDTTLNPKVSGTYDIQSMRTAQVLEWYPRHVKVRMYNDKTGNKEDITLPKNMVAIIENPLYAVMNEPNSTLKRLTHKLNLLDVIDEQQGSNKLDLIIQLPYVVKTDTKRQQANQRLNDIEAQLSKSKFGIAYTDGTERITQLNRPVENNLLTQIDYLTKMLYSQLGMTETIIDGTADDKTMLNYYNRTIEPILSAITEEMKRKFLTKTARSQGQSILFFRNPFKLAPVAELADLADKFTRNEILTSNEFRSLLGYKPSKDPRANELRNKNLNDSTEREPMEFDSGVEETDYEEEGY